MNESLLTEMAANFHFLRPAWFHAITPALLLFLLLRYRQRHHSNWEQAIDPHLLPHLLDNPDRKVSRSPLTLLLLAWLLATLALAGPVWRKTPQPLQEREDALVIILDLTRSMLATDVKPNRLVRAKRKLIDLLKLREEGVTALIVFAGDAHLVSPLTDDTGTIINMIPSLTPDIVPAPGSQLAPALEVAIRLFRDGGMSSGRILIIADEIRDLVAAQRVARQHRNAWPVSVMSVGTPEGAPVPLLPDRPDAGFLRDATGRLVIPKLDVGSLKAFAELAAGRYSPMTLTEEDLNYLLADQMLLPNDDYRESSVDFDIWREEGPWLLLLLLPLASLAFRRGWLWSLALLTLLPPDRAEASLWDDLWQSKDQQGITALKEGDAELAAELFENQAWKGTASYRNGNYEEATRHFGNVQSSSGKYNLGNAFARQGRFDEAIEAWDEALALDPNNEDASFNKKLVEELLQQQQQQEGESSDGEKQQGEQQQSEGQQGEEDAAGQQEDQEEQTAQKENGKEENGKQEDEQEGDERQAAQVADENESGEESEEGSEDESGMDEEEKLALQQWLRRVPDDPGGLLKNKFRQQYETRLREGKAEGNDTTADW